MAQFLGRYADLAGLTLVVLVGLCGAMVLMVGGCILIFEKMDSRVLRQRQLGDQHQQNQELPYVLSQSHGDDLNTGKGKESSLYFRKKKSAYP